MHKLIKLNEEDRQLNFNPVFNTEEVLEENFVFTVGLPKLQDLGKKKRKSEEEKCYIETIKNPPASPFDDDLQVANESRN